MTHMHPGAHAVSTPDRSAVIVHGGGGASSHLTYAQLDRRSDGLARSLRAHGLKAGDVVALCMANSADVFVVAWAAQRSGLYYVAIPVQATADELAYLLQDSGARAIVVDDAFADRVARAVASLGALASSLPLRVANPGDVPGFVSLPQLEESGPHEDYEAVEGSDMLYTSGTTGRPKGVKPALKLEPLGSDRRRVERAQALYGWSDRTVFLVPAPLYHAAPLRFGMTALRLGGTVVVLPKFQPEAALAALRDHAVTHSQWVPTMFHRLLAMPADVRAAFTFPAHRVALHSGAPCSVPIKRAMIDWWGPILHEYYSGSESVGFTHATSAEWLARPGTVGKPHGCTVHVLAPDGREQEPGQIGAVYFESAQKLAYHGDAQKTAAAIGPNGWATMGDLGYVDEEGYLFLTDRQAFTIVSGGVNVYPREVEAALESHPDVREAAVFGVPDADLGERVHAVVVVAEPRRGDSAIESELLEHLRARVAGYKMPRGIELRAELPRGATGKLDKRSLRAEHVARLPHQPLEGRSP